MYTQCPDCATAFRVTASVLKQAAGKVRCGGCGTAFNALEYLSETRPSAPPADEAAEALPELKPEPLDDGSESTPPGAMSAAQSAALLKTLDELAGSNIRLEDTGVEWRLLPDDDDEANEPFDEESYDADALLQAGDTPVDAPFPAEDGDAQVDELLEASPTQVDEFLTRTPGNIDAAEVFADAGGPADDELRFDDNTGLPEDFDEDPHAGPPTAVAETREPIAESFTEPFEHTETQVDLVFGDPDEWNELLDEVDDVDNDVAAAHSGLNEAIIEPEPIDDRDPGTGMTFVEELDAIADENEDVAAGPVEIPPDIDTQFGLQAAALGIDTGGIRDSIEDSSIDEDLMAAAFKAEQAVKQIGAEADGAADAAVIEEPGAAADGADGAAVVEEPGAAADDTAVVEEPGAAADGTHDADLVDEPGADAVDDEDGDVDAAGEDGRADIGAAHEIARDEESSADIDAATRPASDEDDGYDVDIPVEVMPDDATAGERSGPDDSDAIEFPDSTAALELELGVASQSDAPHSHETLDEDQAAAAGAGDFVIPPETEEEQTINRMIDQDLLSLAVADDTGMTSTMVLRAEAEQAASKDDGVEDDGSGHRMPPAGARADMGVETIIMEGEFIRTALEEEALAEASKQRGQEAAAAPETGFIAAAKRTFRGRIDSDDEASGRADYRLVAGVALLFLLLGGQFVHQSRAQLATNPTVSKVLAPVYRAVGAPITPDWDVTGWRFEVTRGSTNAAALPAELRADGSGATIAADDSAVTEPGGGASIVADEPAEAEPGPGADTLPGAADGPEVLTIYSRIGNKSDGPLPYPLVSVSLTDRFEETIGSRVLQPREYLTGSLDPGRLVPAGTTFDAVITIEAPSAEATGFKLNVCYRQSAGRLRCAIEDFK